MTCERKVEGGEGESQRSPVSIQIPAATRHPLTPVLCPNCLRHPCLPAPLLTQLLGCPRMAPSFLCLLASLSHPAGSSILLFRGSAVTAHSFLSGSWCLRRAHTQSQPLSVPTTRQSCHPQWNAQEALGTLGPPPSSKCFLKVGMARGEGQLGSTQGWGGEPPGVSLLHQDLSTVQPSC